MIYILNKRYEDIKQFYIYDFDNNVRKAYAIALDNLERHEMSYNQLATLHNKGGMIWFVNLSQSSYVKLGYNLLLTNKLEPSMDRDVWHECYTDMLSWSSFYYEDEEDDYIACTDGKDILLWCKDTLYRVPKVSNKFYTIYKEEDSLHLGLYNSTEYVVDESGIYLYDDTIEQEIVGVSVEKGITRFQMRILGGYNKRLGGY